MDEKMISALKWLEGQNLIDACKKDFTWFFSFSDGGSITTESCWRLITNDGVAVTSEDDGHQFGLNEKVNAGVRILKETEGKKVRAYSIAERTSDLRVTLEGDVWLDFLCLSSGYESWSSQHRSAMVICAGGGKTVVYP